MNINEIKKCECNSINECTKSAVLEFKDRRGRSFSVCSQKCANELADELSYGTWCPFPTARNALTQKQIEDNLTYIIE